MLRRALPCGDYGVLFDGRLVASVERKSLADLVASLTSGKLRYALAEMAALPRAAVVVEDRYSAIFKLDRVRPALVADGLAEVQVRWPNVPIVFCETRQLAEEWTYRFLAAARAWAETEEDALGRIMPAAGEPATGEPGLDHAPRRARAVDRRGPRLGARPGPPCSDRGKLRPEIWDAWRSAASPEVSESGALHEFCPDSSATFIDSGPSGRAGLGGWGGGRGSGGCACW